MGLDLDVQEAMLLAGLAKVQQKRMQQDQKQQLKTRRRFARTDGTKAALTPSDMDSAASKNAIADLRRADITRR